MNDTGVEIDVEVERLVGEREREGGGGSRSEEMF